MQKGDSMWRSPTDPVILSTIPHFLSLMFVTGCDRGPLMDIYSTYTVIIAISSLLSLVWHFQKERKNIFFWLDYGFALAWTIMDLTVAISTAPVHVILTVAFLNIIVLLTNQLCDFLDRKGFVPYEFGHATWHLLSSTKSIFVAYLVGCRYGVSSCASAI